MRIVLLRHGPAGTRDPSRWPDDAARPLTSRGRERTRRAAQGVRRLVDGVALVLTSPLVRARETADLLAAVVEPEKDVETLDSLAPGGSTRPILARLGRLEPDSTVVLVGHEPDLGKLAGLLVFGAPAPLPLKKAGACSISFADSPAAGTGRVDWLLGPALLRRLARRKDKA